MSMNPPQQAPHSTDGRTDTLPPADYDYILDYDGYHRSPSSCRCRAYLLEPKTPIIVLTELAENPGTSITNRAEYVHYLAWSDRDQPWPCRFMEHYPAKARIALTGERSNEHVSELLFPRRVSGPATTPLHINGRPHGLQFFLPTWRYLDMDQARQLLAGDPGVAS